MLSPIITRRFALQSVKRETLFWTGTLSVTASLTTSGLKTKLGIEFTRSAGARLRTLRTLRTARLQATKSLHYSTMAQNGENKPQGISPGTGHAKGRTTNLAADEKAGATEPHMTQGMANRMQEISDVGTTGRRLIVGCDGTWVNGESDSTIPSNVTRICRSLRSSRHPADASPETPGFQASKKSQIIYYHRGIGTDGGLESKYLGGGTGSELSEHARECYGFLCNNWREGDEIFLFGFSRGEFSGLLSERRMAVEGESADEGLVGAYTVRALSTLIADVGLLTPYGMEWFYEVYEDWKNQNVPSKQVEGPVEKGLFQGMDHRPKIPSGEYRRELQKVSPTHLLEPIHQQHN